MSLSLQSAERSSRVDLPAKLEFLLRPKRYKVAFGGRGGSKSWGIARALIAKAHNKRLRIGCFRELQTSIKDSVHLLLRNQIERMGLTHRFYVTEHAIRALRTGSEFVFKGLHNNASELKSMEDVDIAWVEEAQIVTE